MSACSVEKSVQRPKDNPEFLFLTPQVQNCLRSVYPTVHPSRTRHALSMAAESGHDKFKFTALPTDALGNLKNKSKDSVELFQKW